MVLLLMVHLEDQVVQTVFQIQFHQLLMLEVEVEVQEIMDQVMVEKEEQEVVE
jgi:hypothetical protein